MQPLPPPKLAARLFDWYAGNTNVEDLRGDLEENFYRNAKKKSLKKAKQLYWKQVLSLITSYALWKRKRKSNHTHSSNQLAMLRNYFKIAFRNLIKQKYFAVINITGLAIGMSVSLLLIALISNISSYDNFHTHKDRIYRITSTITEGIETRDYAIAPAALADKLKEESTSLEKVVRINANFSAAVIYNNKEIPLQGYFTDPDFLTMFSFPLLEGTVHAALNKPNQVILTATAARKLFNQENALGKSISIPQIGECEITGILKDLPRNTHVDFDVLVSYATLQSGVVQNLSKKDAWTNFTREYVYFLSKPGVDLDVVQQHLAQIEKETYSTNDPTKASFSIQALDAITMSTSLRAELGETWDLIGIITFVTLALLILLPACFNYSNISIARALKRSKEIGLRKTLGGLKHQIFVQFITETVVITLLSLIIACFIFIVVRNEFQSMMVAANKLDLSLTPKIVGAFLVFALLTGFCAGVVPALYFSKLNPIQALKSTGTTKRFSVSSLKKGLTVVQFALSFSFIIGLVVFSKQYIYTLNFNFGFHQANILDIPLQDVNPDKFTTHFASLSAVNTISYSSGLLGINVDETYARTNGQTDSAQVFQLFVNEHYLPNLGLTLLAGENFKHQGSAHERSIIVNEEFLIQHNMATPADALGKVYRVDSVDLEVIGVVKNFHFMSLREPIYSFFFRYNPTRFTYANLTIASTDINATLTSMEAVWNSISNGNKFEAKFFDKEIAESYDSYKVLLKMTGFLGLLAISISCLGLLGMVVYTTESKTKEVGIRKVMGASAASITYLLSKDYLKLMLIAIVIATPITWLFFDTLLSQLQYYRVTIGILDVLLSIVVLVSLGLGAIATQTLRTAAINPAETLKYE